MRIEGEWGRFDAPYLEVILVSEELGIAEPVKFLIDTGASTTHILDSDAKRLRIDYSKLQKLEHGTAGIGGIVDTYGIPEMSLFLRTSDRGLHEEILDLFVLKHDIKAVKEEGIARIKLLPSLLGRDFLNRYKLILDRANERVTITDEAVP